MGRKRRTKRLHEVTKRCRCFNQQACTHHWWLRVYVKGQRQRINLTEMFPDDAVEVAAAKAKHDAQHGLIVEGRRINTPAGDTRLTFGDICDRYEAAYPKRHHYYLKGLRKLDVPAALGTSVLFGLKPIDDVTTADIEHLAAMWRTRKRTLAGVKGGLVAERHLLQSARHLFNWAKRKGFATRTPFRDAQGTTMITVRASEGRSRRLEAGEEERILQAADPYTRDFFTAMLQTGCRPGELRTLQWSEVRGNLLFVVATKAKTRRERRIPIMPELRTVLDSRRIGPDGHELPDTAYVFGNETGDQMSRRRLCDLWMATCKRAEVVNLHLHDLRAEAGSQLLEAGVALHEVRDALGHSSTTMTNTYLRTRTNSLQSAFEQRDAHRARQRMKAAS